ncbi:hypothetical protein MYP_3042 [Sporocytophaga myxococcoides]|uniref:Uncharacterized protein n=1 Tax=Sporocytophaga myxococcoides TaxID=153721 RepID=A0A098LIC7_9BACT|nr:hypothetical protein [Sporocytophaga myxococcoides]GAL85813.1 hypothetical protein MYP_3042 [Sporocytophaga myxococcoides]
MKPRKIILYKPGIISLILLPIICIGYAYFKGVFIEYRTIPLTYHSAKDPFLKFPERIYEKIIIDNRSEVDKELETINKKIDQICKLNDTINGIQIHFAETAKYESFIKSLNVILRGKYKWFVDKDNIWIFRYPEVEDSTEAFYFICGTVDIEEVQVVEIGWIDQIKSCFASCREYYSFIIVYLFFAVISLINLKSFS